MLGHPTGHPGSRQPAPDDNPLELPPLDGDDEDKANDQAWPIPPIEDSQGYEAPAPNSSELHGLPDLDLPDVDGLDWPGLDIENTNVYTPTDNDLSQFDAFETRDMEVGTEPFGISIGLEFAGESVDGSDESLSTLELLDATIDVTTFPELGCHDDIATIQG